MQPDGDSQGQCLPCAAVAGGVGGNGLKLHQKRFGLGTGSSFFPVAFSVGLFVRACNQFGHTECGLVVYNSLEVRKAQSRGIHFSWAGEM